MKKTVITNILIICMTLTSYAIMAQCLEICTGDKMFHGVNAGASNTTGQYNSFFGPFAGAANTEGDENSFFGQASGGFSNNGSANSFFGYNSGLYTTGSRNSFFGNRAGEANSTGDQNSFFGQGTGMANTTGGHNSFFGQYSGMDNLTGYNNSFFGLFSGGDNTSGHSNSFFGVSAGRDNNASYNSFFGQEAGSSNTSGHFNSFFGRWAGFKNRTGNENTYIGTYAGQELKGNGNVCIGYRSGPTAEDSLAFHKLYIANSTGTPLIYGEFNNKLVRINGEFEVTGGTSNGSSVNIKENFVSVNDDDILSKIIALPITEWSYIAKPDVRHIGPMAQDFRAAFGLGKNDTSISTIDADGVSLAAIKALAQKDAEDKESISELKLENQQLVETVEDLLMRLEKMEKQVAALSTAVSNN